MKSECQNCHRVLNFVIDGKCRKCRWRDEEANSAYITCDICGKTISARYAKSHTSVHDDNTYKCNECDRKFHSERQLKSHVKAHDKDLIRRSLDRRRRTNILRYGGKSYLSSDNGQRRFKRTMTERYGVDCTFKSKDLMDKAKDTMVAKYGHEYPAQVKSIMLAQYESKRRNIYGDAAYELLYDSKALQSLLDSMNKPSFEDVATFIHDNFENSENVTKQLVYNRIRAAGLEDKIKRFGRTSSYEDVVSNWIESCGRDVVRNSRFLDGKEIDVYVKECKLGFEIDGAYWHSADVAGALCQLDKTKLCESKGIDVIHLFEQELVLCEDDMRKFCVSRIAQPISDFDIRKISKDEAFSYYEVHTCKKLPASCSYSSILVDGDIAGIACLKKDAIVSFSTFENIDILSLCKKMNVSRICLDRAKWSCEYVRRNGLNVIDTTKPRKMVHFGHDIYDCGSIICRL